MLIEGGTSIAIGSKQDSGFEWAILFSDFAVAEWSRFALSWPRAEGMVLPLSIVATSLGGMLVQTESWDGWSASRTGACETSVVAAAEVSSRQVRRCATNIRDFHIEFTARLKIVTLLSFAFRIHDLRCGSGPCCHSDWKATFEASTRGTHTPDQLSETIVLPRLWPCSKGIPFAGGARLPDRIRSRRLDAMELPYVPVA